MKIYFRYLLTRLAQPFFICLAACTVIWVMADLYGNMDDFFEHKANLLLVLRFYSLQIPTMLVQVLPAAVLFSTLFTLLSLNRRSELVALQSGGLAPGWLFLPFVLFALGAAFVLAVDLSGPAAQSMVTRDRLLQQVKGQGGGRGVYANLLYVDRINRRTWFFGTLDAGHGTASGVDLVIRDAQGRDMEEYYARAGSYNGEFWQFSDVKKIVYAPDKSVLNQETYKELDQPDVTTPPQQLALIVSEAEQLTLPQLSQYIATNTQSAAHLARFRTEWWYRIFYPLSILVLVVYALLQGTRVDRGNAIAGVFGAIFVLIAFTMVSHAVLGFGRYGRMPPFLAALLPELLFGGVGFYLLAVKNGWGWQLREQIRHWRRQFAEPDEEEPAAPGPGAG